MPPIDEVVLNFSPASLLLMNVILAVVMFGVALDMRLTDFKILAALPRSALIGLLGQFILLPAFTYLLVTLLKPSPSMALGMFLVAACPGGNISNFLTYIARGNTALSVTLSATSTLCAMVMTPLNFTFWGGLYLPAQDLLKNIALHPIDLVQTIVLITGIPMSLGLYISHRYPRMAEGAKKPMRLFSMGVFLLFILGALAANFDYFLRYIHTVLLIVLVHNALALSIGYSASRLLALPERDRRAVAIEVGIQNSGLGLILIFDFFQGLGGMAIVAAWWGIWHLISGMTLALFWSRRQTPGTGAK